MSLSVIVAAVQLAGAQPLPDIPPAPEPAAVEQPAAEPPAAPAQPDGAPTKAEEQASPATPAPADGAIVVTAKSAEERADPLEKVNVESFAVVQSVDKAVTGPAARGYKKTVPGPIRSGLRNFLRNLEEPIVFLNYLLQLKPGKSAETLGRFTVNTTVGIAGLFDVAKTDPFNLPHRRNGFAYTMGYYGVKPGPYMYLPLIGPTTVRDLVGRMGDLSVMPMAVGKPFNQPAYAIPTTVVRLVDERAESDDEIRETLSGPADPYATIRANYLRTRQAEIDALRGKPSGGYQGPSPTNPGEATAPTSK